jgi:5-methylcytosine-specific restriction protein A
MPTIKLLKRKRDSVPTKRKQDYQEIYQDKRWKKIVAAKKRINPLCEEHEKLGRVIQLQEIHHRIPFEWGRSDEEMELLAFDIDNTESVCEKCHEELHKQLKINKKRLGY